MTRPASQREAALYLVELGLNDCQIGRAMAIPHRTIQGWRRPRYVRRSDIDPYAGLDGCPRCGRARLDEASYVYLLGLYLGDGWIHENPRGVQKLMVFCCDRYLHLLIECCDAIAAMRGNDWARIGMHSKDGCIHVYSFWKHWTCLFPQHGPGMKHKRRIILEAWQQDVVARYPHLFLKGLIHSDGWRGTNQGRGSNGKLYFYPRYQFTNNSDDIRRLFSEACHAVGVECRPSGWNTVSVSRRTSVRKLDLFIGPKT